MTVTAAKRIIADIVAWENEAAFFALGDSKMIPDRPHSELNVAQAWRTLFLEGIKNLSKPGRFPKNAGKTQSKFIAK